MFASTQIVYPRTFHFSDAFHTVAILEGIKTTNFGPIMNHDQATGYRIFIDYGNDCIARIGYTADESVVASADYSRFVQTFESYLLSKAQRDSQLQGDIDP